MIFSLLFSLDLSNWCSKRLQACHVLSHLLLDYVEDLPVSQPARKQPQVWSARLPTSCKLNRKTTASPAKSKAWRRPCRDSKGFWAGSARPETKWRRSSVTLSEGRLRSSRTKQLVLCPSLMDVSRSHQKDVSQTERKSCILIDLPNTCQYMRQSKDNILIGHTKIPERQFVDTCVIIKTAE